MKNLFPKKGNYQKAIDHLAKSIQLRPYNPVAHQNMAVAKQNLNEYDEAKKYFFNVIKLEETDEIKANKRIFGHPDFWKSGFLDISELLCLFRREARQAPTNAHAWQPSPEEKTTR